MLAGVLAGIADEWFQWFIPIRAGELRDIGLNAVALGCGLLFGLALEPPARIGVVAGLASRRHAAVLSAAVVFAFAIFVEAVHLGYEITDSDIGTFDSRFTWASLMATRDTRAAAWRTQPPVVLRRLSREDQYLSEGMFHVQWRNRMWSEGNVAAAWWENRILETYYGPVLDAPSYISAAGSRWPPEQRADAAARGASRREPYVSEAYPVPVFTWPRPLFWSAPALLAGLVVVLCRPFSS
jgi:hypothetical protein